MQNGKMIAIMGLISAVMLVGGVLMFTKAEQAKPEPKPVDQSRLVKDDSYKTASASAQVTIVEFADFQCPGCAESAPIMKQVVKEYGGKVNLVYRHFPLNQHKNAFVSAEAAEAAGVQGKFWEMAEMLYARQQSWENEKNPLDMFTGYAKELNLDESKFREFVQKKQAEDKVKRDQSDGFIVGVNSTPTFFVNGYRIGDRSLEGFRGYIEEALQKSD